MGDSLLTNLPLNLATSGYGIESATNTQVVASTAMGASTTASGCINCNGFSIRSKSRFYSYQDNLLQVERSTAMGWVTTASGSFFN